MRILKFFFLPQMSSRSQMMASSLFVEVATACSLCVCQVVPTLQTPSCTPWDRTACISGTSTFPALLETDQLNTHISLSNYCLISVHSPRILEVARCSQLTDAGFTPLARVSCGVCLLNARQQDFVF